MIVGVPNHHDLNETATGWLNLAWDIVTHEAETFQEIEFLFRELEEQHGKTKAEQVVAEHWGAKRLKLNNAISLLQQSLEIFLKAKIAEVSPFLLIAGDPQSWPSPNKLGQVEFSDFRTLDAAHLCRSARIVSTGLTDQFVQFYTRLRKERNKIAHLNASSIKAEVSAILVDILTAHKHLFPTELWVDFRKRYLVSTGEYTDKEALFTGDDYTHDKVCREVSAALSELEPRHAKQFFEYDTRKKGLSCPKCLELRSGDDEWRFAQKQQDGSIKCIACLTSYNQSDYKRAIVEFFGYLGEEGRREVEKDVTRDLR
jgi:hypothetical protein